jgi:DNA-binding CsgD family transcriptional regulator
MMWAMDRPRVAKLRRDVVTLCNQALDLPTFFNRARVALEPVIAHDGCCWMSFDPATILPTSHVPYRSIPPEQVPRLAQNEYGEEDVNKFSVLNHQRPPVGDLSEATGGERERSARYRALLEPNGFNNELRASFAQDGSCWGGVAFYRRPELPDFDAQEALALADISELMALGIRRAVLTQAIGVVDPVVAPGFIMLDGANRVTAVNDEGERWFAELLSEDEGGIEGSSIVQSLASRTRNGDGERSPAQARMRTRTGTWVVLHGSLVGGPEEGRLAIIIEPARPPQIAPIIAMAYGLTPRERDVARLVVQGFSTTEIADDLHLSPHTVQDHLKSIFDKVGVRSRRELVTRVFSEQYATRMAEGVAVGADGWFVR